MLSKYYVYQLLKFIKAREGFNFHIWHIEIFPFVSRMKKMRAYYIPAIGFRFKSILLNFTCVWENSKIACSLGNGTLLTYIHVFSMCAQTVNGQNTGVQSETPATVVTPFKAENEITERESHNPQWTEAGFQPNSSSIPPSNNMQLNLPLTPEDKNKEWNKNNNRHHRGNNQARRAEVDEGGEGRKGRIKERVLCVLCDCWQNCLYTYAWN